MALNSPLEVSVGRNTPVHIHVSRNPKSKVQALNESLAHEYSRSASYARQDLSVDDLRPCCDCYAYRTRRCCDCHRSGR